MIYPQNFEQKIGFDEIRQLLKACCLSQLGKDLVDEMNFKTDVKTINKCLQQTREFRRIISEHQEFPLDAFLDVRQELHRVRLQGTHLEENELFDIKRSLTTIIAIVDFFKQHREEQSDGSFTASSFPALTEMAMDVPVFPQIVASIDRILDKYGRMKDTASPKLSEIRIETRRAQSSVSRTLNGILKSAQSEGLVEKDATLSMRDGRLVIPVTPSLKRKLSGIVHDESATGKTVYIEPTQVVETNNRIRELEGEEHREVIRILTELSKVIRPNVDDMLQSFDFLAQIDFVRARALFAIKGNAIEPNVGNKPYIDWIHAVHPLLSRKKEVVPLDISLTSQNKILIISGPNAGGKSVCLKTVGLLQYMVQCGLSIPVSDRSTVGLFHQLMIDIGDEQSLENDLSTYSSHLLNMKNMMKQGDGNTLILIDEFGTGTEPQIGAAMAESILKQFCRKQMYGVITTHYQNLKYYAESHDGVVNGAMLYDRHEMRPLFQLAIGRPGSSFAIEIARKIGIPEVVIKDASEIVGSDYIQSDKYLQDIVRDKRYWESKRQTIHQREKDVDKTINRYEERLSEVEQQRRAILEKARKEAEELLQEANKRIENTIRKIRESQAEKEETRLVREQLKAFSDEVKDEKTVHDRGLMDEASFNKKLEEMKRKKERKEKRAKEKQEAKKREKANVTKTNEKIIQKGDVVRLKGLSSLGKVENLTGKQALVIFGNMRTTVAIERLEKADATQSSNFMQQTNVSKGCGLLTRETIDTHRNDFKPELDVRGLRGDEALLQVQHFIDDAILVGAHNVRILHGKGNGILRQLIQQYLRTIPNVLSVKDEHIQFGGTGITVVEL